jgi:cyclopropane fatty-acyl-phospholipid synthase-like methyltransferase
MMSNPYNQLDYPGHMRVQAHPRRLEAIAHLYGLTAPPVATCRLLEMGCGDGAHLIGIAAELPDVQCVGYDLAEAGLVAGNQAIARLGLKNISLHQGDIMELADKLGEFDYIVAHGLYSWVPPAVREGLLALCGRALTKNGVAFISYHVLPGGHMRRMLDEMLRYHVRNIDDPLAKVAAARQFSDTLSEWRPDNHPYAAVLHQERDRLTEMKDYSVFHDDLAEWNDPILVSDFAAHAARHGLSYLADADFTTNQPRQAPQALLDSLKGKSRLEREQYHDFWAQRVFRHTLLHRTEQPVLDNPNPAAVETMYVMGLMSCDSTDPAQLAGEARVVFRSEEQDPVVSITIAHPAFKAALLEIIRLWPEAVSFDAWVEAVRRTLTASGPSPYADMDPATLRAGLRGLALQGYTSGFLDLVVTPPRLTAHPGQKPRAYSLARLQAESAQDVMTLVGKQTKIEGALRCQLLRSLDGTRDRDQIVRELLPHCAPDRPDLPPELRNAPDLPAALSAFVDETISKLSRTALFQPE